MKKKLRKDLLHALEQLIFNAQLIIEIRELDNNNHESLLGLYRDDIKLAERLIKKIKK